MAGHERRVDPLGDEDARPVRRPSAPVARPRRSSLAHLGGDLPPRARRAERVASVSIDAATSSSVAGRARSPRRRPGRPTRARPLTAHTAHRSWVTITSGRSSSMSAASTAYSDRPSAIASRTCRSISTLSSSAGRSAPPSPPACDDLGRVLHSFEPPTRESIEAEAGDDLGRGRQERADAHVPDCSCSSVPPLGPAEPGTSARCASPSTARAWSVSCYPERDAESRDRLGLRDDSVRQRAPRRSAGTRCCRSDGRGAGRAPVPITGAQLRRVDLLPCRRSDRRRTGRRAAGARTILKPGARTRHRSSRWRRRSGGCRRLGDEQVAARVVGDVVRAVQLRGGRWSAVAARGLGPIAGEALEARRSGARLGTPTLDRRDREVRPAGSTERPAAAGTRATVVMIPRRSMRRTRP